MRLLDCRVEECVLSNPETFSAQHRVRDELHRHDKTAGEQKFNWLTYTGVGYAANVVISLLAVYGVERTRGGQWLIGKLGKGFARLGANADDAKFLARKSFFLTGGFAVIPVMKWLEDHKVEMVKKYNREIYGNEIDRDPAISRSEHELEVAPKQSWASFISGRFLALVPFYATVGLLWDRESAVGLLTNPKLRGMSKEARRTMARDEPEKFAQIASQGWYFDRPISHFSRDLGKLVSSRGTAFDGPEAGAGVLRNTYRGALSLAGKLLRFLPEDRATITRLEQMEKDSPGMLVSEKKPGGKHDPIHAALPYYVVSEAITSAMVAWGLYVITRVTGPFFDRKKHEAPEDAAPAISAVTQPAAEQPAKPRTTVTARQPLEKLDIRPPEPQLSTARHA